MRIVLTLIIVVLFNMSNLASGWAQKKEIAIIQEKYNGILEIQGYFVQKSYIKDLEESQKFKGQFSIKLPNKMRWSYTYPRDEEVIIKNKDIWIYKKAEKQAIKSTFNENTYGQAPIALLAGLGNIEQQFKVSKVESNVLKLQPREPMGAIKTIFLRLSKWSFPISSLTLIDVYGNEITITVDDIKINKGIDESFFDFTPPDDVEVYTFGNES